MKNEQKKMVIKYVLFFFITAALCWFFPYTGDDWAWGGHTGMDRLLSGFQDYGGRYAGYILSMIMTRSNLVKTLIMAVNLTAIVFLIERLTKCKYAFLISCVVLLAMPRTLLSQAVVWSSGFANYVISTTTILLYVCYMQWLFSDSEIKKRPVWHCVPLFVLGGINSLIVEHMTIYNVVLSLFLLGYGIKKFKKCNVQNVVYLVGAVIGTFFMFTNSAYSASLQGTDHYREIASTGIIKRVFYNYFYEISSNLLENNVMLILLLTGLFTSLTLLLRRRENKQKLNKLVLCGDGLLWIYSMYSIYSMLRFGFENKPRLYIYFDGVVTFGAIIVILLLTLYYTYVFSEQKSTTYFYLGSIIMMTLPLFAVSPIGSRCFFPMYVFWVLVVCSLSNIITGEKYISYRKWLQSVGTAFIIVAYVGYLLIYIRAGHAIDSRLVYCRQCVEEGDKQIVMEKLGFDQWLWSAEPSTDTYEERFKDFYHLPSDLKIEIVED